MAFLVDHNLLSSHSSSRKIEGLPFSPNAIPSNRVIEQVAFIEPSTQVSISDAGLNGRALSGDDTEKHTYEDPRAEGGKQQAAIEEDAQKEMDKQVRELAKRDREVRTHEQAHMAAGGQYAGSATYQYERGPNGVSYAVSGEVSISSGKAATPEETIVKAQVIRAAALAPAEPSSQDRKVAAMATQIESEARREIAVNKQEDALKESEASSEKSQPKEKPMFDGLEDDIQSIDSPPIPTARVEQSFTNTIHSLYSDNHQRPGILLSDHA